MGQLLVISCPRESGLWVIDAKSVLDVTNCIRNCAGLWSDGEEYNPKLEYRTLDQELQYVNLYMTKTQEFSYGIVHRNPKTFKNELVLKYVDMLVVK